MLWANEHVTEQKDASMGSDMQPQSLTRACKGHTLGLTWTFSCIFLVSQVWSAPGTSSLCCVGSVPEAPGRTTSADADSSVSALSLEGWLLAGACILSVCKALCWAQSLLTKHWTEKESYLWAGLGTSWVAALNHSPAILTWGVLVIGHVCGWPPFHGCRTGAKI